MSANEVEVLQLTQEINAAPDDPPLPTRFQELDLVSDTRDGNDVTVFFDGQRIEHQAAYIWVNPGSVVGLEEVR